MRTIRGSYDSGCLAICLYTLNSSTYRANKNRDKSFYPSGVNGETIGVIGMGWIGRRLTEHLHRFGFHVLASDPYLTVERAAELDVEKVSLEELFKRSYILDFVQNSIIVK